MISNSSLVKISIDISAFGSSHISFRVALLPFGKLPTQFVHIKLKYQMLKVNSEKSFCFVEVKQS
jgi:hypothetical protein